MPGQPKRKDGYRPYIGGPYMNRLGINRAEYLVLIEMWNRLADMGVDVRRRQLSDGELVEVEVKPFIKKLLRLGQKNGWVHVPSSCPLK